MNRAEVCWCSISALLGRRFIMPVQVILYMGRGKTYISNFQRAREIPPPVTTSHRWRSNLYDAKIQKFKGCSIQNLGSMDRPCTILQLGLV